MSRIVAMLGPIRSHSGRWAMTISGASQKGRQTVVRFAEDAAGGVLLMFGLMALVIFMFIGAAVDLSRWSNARDQTISAIDAAVLAAGRALQTNGGNHSAAIAVAQRYYQAAVQNRLQLISDTIAFSVVEDGTAVTASGNAIIRTPFMGIGGVESLPLIKNSTSEYSKAQLAVGGNAELNIEMAMMLDISGSMAGTKLADLKTAAKDLVNIIVWENQGTYTSKVAVVPFSADVRPPTSLPSSIYTSTGSTFSRSTGSGKNRKTYYFAPTPCVGERSGNDKYTDAAPGSNKLITRIFTQVSNSSTSTGTCAAASTGAVLPLTNVKSTINAKIDSLTASGGTAGHVGTAWSYYMLSPKWGSLLTGVSKPAAYGLDNHKKIAVLMSDGEYNYTYDPDKAGTTATAGSNDFADSLNQKTASFQAVQICSQMKASGIEVYTVGFQLGGNQTAINTLNSCATDAGHAYTADDGEELKRAFRDIALKVSTLYLSQ
ncbi:MAG: VWA domain-containing protein [Hyphomicrobium sp.]|nr:MAG: VWA domain-containing protein [Hyphomicrobium sp.]PPD01300.1 MAG: VWA domain-containing protein [Hyphomicrobium sp.]